MKDKRSPKEYLNQAWDLKLDIERKQKQIIELQAMAERTTSSYDALRVSGTSEHSKLENAVIRLVSIRDELGIKITKFSGKYEEITTVIDAVENSTYRQLLTYRYLGFMTWEAIAVEMDYSYYHVVHRIHPKALNSIIIPERL